MWRVTLADGSPVDVMAAYCHISTHGTLVFKAGAEREGRLLSAYAFGSWSTVVLARTNPPEWVETRDEMRELCEPV